jgi:deazaflavin-dependent oxidoreductase (nitroreductase family)
MASTDLEHALNDSRELDLTTTGRTTGRESSRIVWFVRHGETIDLLPVSGSDTQWYKNVLKTPTVRLSVGGAAQTANATALTDPDAVAGVVDRFRAKYGEDVERYYPKRDVAVALEVR